MSGLDRFIREFTHLKKVPLGVLSNHASLALSGYPAAYELLHQGYSVRKIFSPEHGITAQGEDGAVQPDGLDALTGLPVTSLYGKTQHPQEKDLKGIELILIDLPNIGCRFYTYWWTITCMMEICGRLNKKIILLDRANLSQRTTNDMEGPMLDESNCSSFLGRWRMPLTYAYSYGQLARWFIKDKSLDVSVEVVGFDKVKRDQPFVPTSPSMPDRQAVMMYPCTGLFEGLNLNTGRGTSFPFRVIGAPWIDAIRLYKAFLSENFPGVTAHPYAYRPDGSRYSGSTCYGLYFIVHDVGTFRPVRTGIWLMNRLSILYPDQLTLALYPTAANPAGENHLDRLLGVRNAFETFCSGKEHTAASTHALLDVSDWTRQVDSFLGE